MPPPRTPNYPLDVTQRFTTAQQNQIGAGIGPVGEAASGVLHGPQGDLRNFVTFGAVRSAHRETYRASAYADLIDQSVAVLHDKADGLLAAVQGLEAKVATLQNACDTMTATVQQLVAFMGVVIPAWLNREEVERGDDMGIVRPSAADLELVVEFEFVRQVPGFSHEDVVSMTPPAGTLVKRGSTVKVVLNLEG